MKILHVVPSYIPAWRYGGPIWSVHGLCRGLVKLGHEVHVFTTDVDGPGKLDVPLGVPVELDGVWVWYFPSNWLRRIYWSAAMRRELKRQVSGFDVLHLHSIFLWPTSAAAHIARGYGVPYVVAPRGMLVRELIAKRSRYLKLAWLKLFERRNLEHAATVHFTSRVEVSDAESFGWRFRSTCIVQNGVDADAFMADLADDGQQLPEAAFGADYVLYLGRVNWKKGIDRLIGALALLPGCRLLIAGNDEEGYRDKLAALAKQHGVEDRVCFLGPVYGPRKTALLRRAQMLVLPSYSENFGNVVLEAMAAACPVVVTPEVGAAEIVREVGAGVVVEGAPERLAEAMRSLLAAPESLKSFGIRGREAVLSRYTWVAIAAEMAHVYEEIVERGRVRISEAVAT